MAKRNQKQDKIGTLFVSELDCPPDFDSEPTEDQSFDFDVDAYAISSTVFVGAQGRSIIPLKMEMEGEIDMRCKRLKLMTPPQQCVYLSIPENSSPLGLTLRKTPSFLDLVETKLSHLNSSCSESSKRKDIDADASAQQINGKTKASNFTASLLRIGSWERVSRHDGELVAKCYFAKRKLVWEVLDSGLKNKIEVLWSDIASFKATCNDNGPQTLEIELLRRPLFFQETNPQPRKHTLWKATVDFTGGQASTFRRHFLQFPQGTLQKHYEKLLQLDSRLSSLSKRPYPSLDSPFFGAENAESQNPNDHNLFMLEGQSSNLLKQLLDSRTSDDYPEQFHCFTLSTTTGPQQYSNLDHTVASETSSSSSGASGGFLGHGTSISTANVFPSVFVPLPPSVSDNNTPDMSEGHHHVGKKTEEAMADLVGNSLGVSGLQQGKLNSRVSINSTFDFKSNCWISGIQADQNIVCSSEDDGQKSEIDRYFGGFSYSGDVNGNLEEEISGNCAEFLANISSTTPFPVLVVEDQVVWNELGEVFEMPWT